MGLIEICISFQIAILGVAYPIILQVITDLDSKYSSTRITQLFEGEKAQNIFHYTLCTSLFMTLIYVIHNILSKFIDDSTLLNSLITIYSIGFLIITSTIVLVYIFIGYVSKVMTYYKTHKLILLLKERDEKANK